MRTALMLLIAVTLPVFASQNTMWTWVDDQGVTHYSDRPRPGAKQLQVSAPPPSTPPGGEASSAPAPALEAQSQQAPEVAYAQFSFEQPQHDQTIINTGGAVDVSLQITPILRAGHVLELQMDGQTVPDFPLTGQNHTLTEVPRGTHVLQAFIRDTQGTLIQQSEPIRIHVRQTSIAQPPVGPALRPRPRN